MKFKTGLVALALLGALTLENSSVQAVTLNGDAKPKTKVKPAVKKGDSDTLNGPLQKKKEKVTPEDVQRKKVAEEMAKTEAELEKKEIEEAGKTNRQRQREEREFNKKVAEAADKKDIIDHWKESLECKKHREEEEKEQQYKYWGQFVDREEATKKATTNGNDYAANLPDKHFETKKETWEWVRDSKKA